MTKLKTTKRLICCPFRVTAAEVHWTYISQIERGVKSPTLRIIEDLAEALEIEVSVLVQMAEQESPADAGLWSNTDRMENVMRKRFGPIYAPPAIRVSRRRFMSPQLYRKHTRKRHRRRREDRQQATLQGACRFQHLLNRVPHTLS